MPPTFRRGGIKKDNGNPIETSTVVPVRCVA